MCPKGRVSLSQWDKLIAEILECKPTLRFDDLKKALEKWAIHASSPTVAAVIILSEKMGVCLSQFPSIRR